MKDLVLDSLNLSDFGLKDNQLLQMDERSVVVTRWNWDYELAHKFQKASLGLVQKTPHLRLLICCNHPQVLTNGRGLQKPRKGEFLELVEFNPDIHLSLPFSLHQVERGGGLTFHHPGQFIFYPILKLNPRSLSLSKMTDEIFNFSIEILRGWGLEGVHHNHPLLGLWHKNKKLASMGIAIEKLVTFHGMALNLKEDKTMRNALRELNPCGLSAHTYAAVENLINLPDHFLDKFQHEFLKRIAHEWK